MDPEIPSSQDKNVSHSLSYTEEDVSVEVPDGGLTAWSTVAGAWLVLFATFGYLYSYGVYQDFYTRSYLSDHSTSSIAWIGSFQLMMPFFLGVVSGKLFDKGHFHAVELFGCSVFTFSLFMLSLTKPHQYYQVFLSQGVGMGIGLGFTFVPTVGIAVHHFKKRRSFAVGVAMSGSSCGAVTFPIMLNHLIPQLGFAKAVRASAYLVLGFVVLGNALMKTRLPPQKARPQVNIKDFFKDLPYMLSTIAGLIASFGFYFPVVYLQLYAVLHHVDGTLAFYSLPIMNGSSAIGRILGNYMADYFGPFNMFVPCTLITGGTIWSIIGVYDRASLITVSILYGLFSGAWLALAIATLASFARRPEESGARIGLSLALTSFASLGSAPVQGALLTGSFQWLRTVAFSGSAVFASSILYGIARMLFAQRRGEQRV